MEHSKIDEIFRTCIIDKNIFNNKPMLMSIQEKIMRKKGAEAEQACNDMKISEILLKNHVITEEQFVRGFEEQERSGGSLIKHFVKLDFIKESKLISLLGIEFGLEVVNLSPSAIPADIAGLITPKIALKHHIIPYKKQNSTLFVATSDPTKTEVIDDIKFYTGLNVEFVLAPESEISEVLSFHYNASNILTEDKELITTVSEEKTGEGETIDISEFQESSFEKPIIQFIDKVLYDAVKKGASDIHFEPFEHSFDIRCRIDGKLNEYSENVPIQYKDILTSRIKIMSQLDIAEKRRPQDGRIKLKVENREVDIRVSVIPTLFGEKIVLRILDKMNLQFDMGKLGFSENQLKDFEAAIRRPYGMILVTGPTGSGKSTTLYSAISTLNNKSVNIMTVEDPVEYDMKGINQVQVNEEINLTFSSTLRSFLRQDPDIIMVGEIRDLDTAEIAIKAALTGHLVLSTIHTNNAPSTISRLMNIGVEPFLIASSLNLIIAQRLIRKLCTECKEAYIINEFQNDEKTVPRFFKSLGIAAESFENNTFYRAKGCEVCFNTGYKGRIAIYEMLNVTDNIKDLIYQRASESQIEKVALDNGMIMLREAAKEKFISGITSLEEVLQYLK